MIFETERLSVRLVNDQDHDFFYQLQGNPAVMRFIRPIKTREESDAALNEMLASGEPEEGGRWMVEEKTGGRFVGTLAIIPVPYDTTKIQLGYALVPGEWGKGYATELAVAGLGYFWKHSDRNEIYAITEVPNIASQKVLLKAGFHLLLKREHEGKPILVYIAKRRS
jgi:[ribosomal protein S5]-alanine N-acetyltransferase